MESGFQSPDGGIDIGMGSGGGRRKGRQTGSQFGTDGDPLLLPSILDVGGDAEDGGLRMDGGGGIAREGVFVEHGRWGWMV